MSAPADETERPRATWVGVIKTAALAIAASLVFILFEYVSADGVSGVVGVLAGGSFAAYVVTVFTLLIVSIVRIARWQVARAAAPLVALIILASHYAWIPFACDMIDVARFYYGRDFYEKVVREKTADGVTGSVRFFWGDTGFAGNNSFHDLYYAKAEGDLPQSSDRCRKSYSKITEHFYSVRSGC